MKKLIKIAFLSILGAGFYQSVNAQVKHYYYVCAGETFTLATNVNADDYKWTELSGSTTISGTNSTPSITATNLSAGDDAVSLEYEFSVSTGGCWSDPEIYVVHILPPIDVEITGAALNYCTGNPQTVDLEADFTTGILPPGVAADKFQWTVGGVPGGTGKIESITTSTSVGSTDVDVAVSYSLPGTSEGSKLSACDGQSTSTVSIIVSTTPTTPVVTIQ